MKRSVMGGNLEERREALVLKGEGLVGMHWDLLYILMEVLDMVDLVALNKTSKELNILTRRIFDNVVSLKESFKENKLFLALLMDSQLIENKVHNSDVNSKFLLIQKTNLHGVEITKTLFKVNLPDEPLYVAQATYVSKSDYLYYHFFCIQYQGKKEHLHFTHYCSFGWSKDPLEFLSKYCKLLSLNTPQDVHHFFCTVGKLNEKEELELQLTNTCDSSLSEVNFDMFFEFGKNEAIYYQFIHHLEKIVIYEHLKSQLFKVIPKQLRLSHAISNWKQEMITHNYYDFPKVDIMKLLIQDLSLVAFDENCDFLKFQVYLKKIQQKTTLNITFDNINLKTNLKINMKYIPPTKEYHPLSSFLNSQLDFDISHALWDWAIWALTKSVVDALKIFRSRRKWSDYKFESTITCKEKEITKL